MNTVGLLIAGVDCDAADGRTFDCLNPITGEVVTRSAAQIEAGIHKFTDLRWITVQHGPRHYPI